MKLKMCPGWYAMDLNGRWFWYEKKPYRDGAYWTTGDCCLLKKIPKWLFLPCSDWNKSLIEVTPEGEIQ